MSIPETPYRDPNYKLGSHTVNCGSHCPPVLLASLHDDLRPGQNWWAGPPWSSMLQWGVGRASPPFLSTAGPSCAGAPACLLKLALLSKEAPWPVFGPVYTHEGTLMGEEAGVDLRSGFHMLRR